MSHSTDMWSSPEDHQATSAMFTGQWASRLREAGLRVTRSRVQIMHALHEVGGHPSSEELVQWLRSGVEPIPRATVYKVLEDLAECGVVMRADHGSRGARYELAEVWHHHFVCRECGVIMDVPCVRGEKPCLDANFPDAEIDEAQVIFRGLCLDCASTERASALPRALAP